MGCKAAWATREENGGGAACGTGRSDGDEDVLPVRDVIPQAAGVEVAAVQQDAGEREREVEGMALWHEAPMREQVRVARLEDLRARGALPQVAHGDVGGVVDVRLDRQRVQRDEEAC